MMRKTFTIMALMVAICTIEACTTVDRPDLPTPSGYKMEQDRLLGVLPMKPYMVSKPTKAQVARTIIQRPAIVVLSVCLPIALLAFAASIALQNPSLTKKLSIVAITAFIAAFSAAVWIMASMYVVVGGAALAGLGALAYFKFHGTGFKWHKEEAE